MLNGEQWLEQEFFPMVAALPDPATSGESKRRPSSPPEFLLALTAWRLLGALDALLLTGVLTTEQESRARASLDAKGVQQTQVSHTSFAGSVSVVAGRATPMSRVVERPPEKESLVRVIGVGRSFGLVDGEDAILTAVEVWQRSVRAGFLIAIGEESRARQQEHQQQMHEWLTRRRMGEVTDADRPDAAFATRFPATSATWTLDVAGTSHEGRFATGHGGQHWWRVEIEWDTDLPNDANEIVLAVEEHGRTVARMSVSVG